MNRTIVGLWMGLMVVSAAAGEATAQEAPPVEASGGATAQPAAEAPPVEASAGATAQPAVEAQPVEAPPMEASAEATASPDVEASGVEASVEPTPSPGIFGVGAEVGGALPFNALGPHVSVGLEVGFRLPMMNHQLEILLGAAYTPPGNDVTDGEYEGDIVEQELTFSLGPRFRFARVDSDWNASLGAGFRLFLLQSRSNGSAGGEKFAEFREHSTQAGFYAALGGERRLGPGALSLDLDFGYSKLPHKISGDTSTANLGLTLGYRLYF